ncbi:MAG: hypothetical protein AAF823_04045 [Planctomycetota bacterium]
MQPAPTLVAALAALLIALAPAATPTAHAGHVSFRIGVGFSSHGHVGHRVHTRTFKTYTFSHHHAYACRPYRYRNHRPFRYCGRAYRPAIVHAPHLHTCARMIYAQRPTVFHLQPAAQVAPPPRAPRHTAARHEGNTQQAAAPSPFPQRPADRVLQRAQDALALGEYRAARDAYAQASAMNPTHPDPKIGFGLAAALDGDLHRARLALQRAFRLSGADAFDRFTVDGTARHDLHALLNAPHIEETTNFLRNALKKIAQANPPAPRTYQQQATKTPNP